MLSVMASRVEEKSLTVADIKKFLDGIIEKCDAGILKAKYDNGLFATYFYHEVTEYDLLDQVASWPASCAGQCL